MSLASDDPEHVIVVPGRHFAPTVSAGSATAISGDEVEGDFAQEGEVAGGGTVAHATVVLAEGDVEHPMQGVFDAPVPADGLDQDGGIIAATAEQGLRMKSARQISLLERQALAGGHTPSEPSDSTFKFQMRENT